MKYFECQICSDINSVRRMNCQHCGTIPARYSILNKPTRLIHDDLIEVCRAIGCMKAYPAHAKMGLRTVPAGYYAAE